MTNTDFVNPGQPAQPVRPQTPLQQALTHLAAWQAADLALATSESYEIDGRRITRANGDTVKERIAHYQNEVCRLMAGRGVGPRRTTAVPRG